MVGDRLHSPGPFMVFVFLNSVLLHSFSPTLYDLCVLVHFFFSVIIQNYVLLTCTICHQLWRAASFNLLALEAGEWAGCILHAFYCGLEPHNKCQGVIVWGLVAKDVKTGTLDTGQTCAFEVLLLCLISNTTENGHSLHFENDNLLPRLKFLSNPRQPSLLSPLSMFSS